MSKYSELAKYRTAAAKIEMYLRKELEDTNVVLYMFAGADNMFLCRSLYHHKDTPDKIKEIKASHEEAKAFSEEDCRSMAKGIAYNMKQRIEPIIFKDPEKVIIREPPKSFLSRIFSKQPS